MIRGKKRMKMQDERSGDERDRVEVKREGIESNENAKQEEESGQEQVWIQKQKEGRILKENKST